VIVQVWVSFKSVTMIDLSQLDFTDRRCRMKPPQRAIGNLGSLIFATARDHNGQRLTAFEDWID
jgi:hypothetical protein